MLIYHFCQSLNVRQPALYHFSSNCTRSKDYLSTVLRSPFDSRPGLFRAAAIRHVPTYFVLLVPVRAELVEGQSRRIPSLLIREIRERVIVRSYPL